MLMILDKWVGTSLSNKQRKKLFFRFNLYLIAKEYSIFLSHLPDIYDNVR